MAEASLLVLAIKETGEVALTAQRHLSEQQQALARVAAVQNRLAQHSDWSEQACRLHDDSFAAIVEARIPRLFLPKGLDGDEVNPMTCAWSVKRSLPATRRRHGILWCLTQPS